MSVIGFHSQEEWSTVYEVMSLTRGDLQSAGLSPDQVDTLTDTDLVEIASRLGQAILDAGIWDDLPALARRVLAEKQAEETQHGLT